MVLAGYLAICWGGGVGGGHYRDTGQAIRGGLVLEGYLAMRVRHYRDSGQSGLGGWY